METENKKSPSHTAHILCFLFLFLMGCQENKTNKAGENKNNSKELDNLPMESTKKKVIMFFGNSITAGYRLALDKSFPAIIGFWLDSLGYDYEVINAGLSGETSAAGKNRIEWVLRTVPDIFILELGANDGLMGLPLKETSKNLQEIIEKVRQSNPNVKVIIAGMKVPPNLGQEYISQFDGIFPELAKKTQAALIPFILDKVAGERELNLEDGIHPNVEGHLIIANTVFEHLLPYLDKK